LQQNIIQQLRKCCKRYVTGPATQRYSKLRGNRKAAIMKDMELDENTAGTVGAGALVVGKGTSALATGKKSGTLKKSDPRYKIMKEKGWV
jgi:hypothetical protein